MDIFTISAPLVISCLLRVLVAESNITLLADNLLIVVFIQWLPRFWISFFITLAISIGLAFYETRAEYMDSRRNAREIGPEIPKEISSIKVNSPSPPNNKSDMCPVKSFDFLRSTTNNALPTHHVNVEEEMTLTNRYHKGTAEPQELHGKPILFPCQLRHLRITPFKDSFQHSFLYVGTPVGLHAVYSPILSIDSPQNRRNKWPFREAWFNIKAQDHGIRGGTQMSLSQKLTEYLLSVREDPNEWAYAYLIATPSINGQVDNPLGFWYLYTAKRELTAIIPELNTSYGERRMWVVRNSLPPLADSENPKNSPYAFRGHFGKDIHVSPFMPPSGGYTISTSDPCARPSNKLEILVTLTKPGGGSLLVTRVTPSGPGLEVSTASMQEKMTFLARWFWVPTTTVMTYRILSQAARIYAKAPRVWTRPEPIKTALGKPARAVERTLERSFRLILKAAVESHPSPISLTYSTPGEHTNKLETFSSAAEPKSEFNGSCPADDTITPPASPDEIRSTPSVNIQVISPIFFSRFFHYQCPHDAFTNELLDDVRTRTLWSSDPSLFMTLFEPMGEASIKLSDRHWQLISCLRAAPIATNFPRNKPYQPFKGLSSMDIWVLKNCSPEDVKEYRRALLRVFLGEWVGGTVWPLKLFSYDMEPFGLSRDAVMRIYDAVIRAGIIGATIEVVKGLEVGCGHSMVGVAGWAVAGLNLWTSLKAVL